MAVHCQICSSRIYEAIEDWNFHICGINYSHVCEMCYKILEPTFVQIKKQLMEDITKCKEKRLEVKARIGEGI